MEILNTIGMSDKKNQIQVFFITSAFYDVLKGSYYTYCLEILWNLLGEGK